VRQDVAGVNLAIQIVRELETNGPGEVLRVVSFRGRENEHLGYVKVVSIFANREITRAKTAKNEGNVFLLHEPPGLLDCLRWAEGIIEADQLDLATTLAAALRAKVAVQVTRLVADHALVHGLAMIKVGADPASAVYVRSKMLRITQAGIRSDVLKRVRDNDFFEDLTDGAIVSESLERADDGSCG
jgi:hypothetical protein